MSLIIIIIKGRSTYFIIEFLCVRVFKYVNLILSLKLMLRYFIGTWELNFFKITKEKLSKLNCYIRGS